MSQKKRLSFAVRAFSGSDTKRTLSINGKDTLRTPCIKGNVTLTTLRINTYTSYCIVPENYLQHLKSTNVKFVYGSIHV